MRKIVVILFVLVSLSVFAKSAVVVLEENISYKISADKLVTKHVYQKVRLNSSSAFRHWGEWFYTYNPELQKVEIIKSETTMKNGKKVNTPENGLLIQSPYATENSPDFSNIREYMVSHIGLEPGCVVEFEYEISDLKPHQLVIFEQLGGDFEVLKKTVTIEGKYEKIFFTKSVNKQGNTFTVTNLPSYNLSYYHHSLDEMPYVACVLGNVVDKLKIGFEKNSHDNLVKTISVLKLSSQSPRVQVIEKVKDFINNKLVTVKLPIEKLGYERRSIDGIANSGYGTDFEKACFASVVFSFFNIDCNVSALNENSNLADVLIAPSYSVNIKNETLVYPAQLSLWGKLIKLLKGKEFSFPATKNCDISIELEEQSNGLFLGKIYAEGTNLSSSLNFNKCNFLKGSTITNKTTSRLTLNGKAIVGTMKYTPESDVLMLSKQLKSLVKVDLILYDLLNSTSLNFANKVTYSIFLTVTFNFPMKATFKNNKKVVNEFGTSIWQWKMENKKLQFTGKLVLNKGVVNVGSFEKIRNLLEPFLADNTKVVFLSKE